MSTAGIGGEGVANGESAAAPENEAESQKGTWRQALSSFALSIFLILAFRWAFFEPYVIPSGSMIPTLLIHDHILVNKFAYGIRVPFTKTWLVRFAPPERGDVVVFNSVEERGIYLVKRVVGLPGDVVELGEDGRLRINGELPPSEPISQKDAAEKLSQWSPDKAKPFAEDYVLNLETLGRHAHVAAVRKDKVRYPEGPFRVPEGHVFMMGDNRDNSNDSRVWGTLPIDYVLGRAVAVWLSCEETLKQAAQVCDPQTVRWSRLFSKVE